MNEYKLEIGGRTLVVKPHYLSEQANGSILIQYGDTVVLVNATMSKQDKEFMGFFPLSVDYEEKFYAVGKIKGSRFTKREGRPSDIAILSSRLIDRAIRPRFDKDFNKETQVIATCLSWDEENDPDILSLVGASISLLVSDIPWNGPLGAVRIGRVNGEFILNPTNPQREESDINIVFAGLENEKGEIITNMIEGGLEEIEESVVVEAFKLAQKTIKELCDFQKKIVSEVGKKKIVLENNSLTEEFKVEVEKEIGAEIKNIFSQPLKKEEQSEKLNVAEDNLLAFIKEKYSDDETKINEGKIILDELISEAIKENILLYDKRPDGRTPEELRDLNSEIGILPRTHGSAIFSRGETRALSILTLGAPGDHQILEGMEINGMKRFMHHYNFPPYSVGEVKPLRGPSRRDIGHGTLAEKALFPLIPSFENFPYTVRIVSEVLSSNGSTSMASVTSASLALLDAGVPVERHVSGISIGIIKNDKGDYKLLTDIQGPEDHYGGMDFKAAGTRKGLTALQMDVKIDGISIQILEEALMRAKEARSKILSKMESTLEKTRDNLSPFAPRVITIQINPEKIREVIGPGGKVINEIIAETGATIDIEDSGRVFVTSEKKESAEKAIEWIKNITREAEVGEVFEGKVTKILEFGCFVEFLPGQEGLVHISKMADHRVEKVSDIVSVGDVVSVKVIEIDAQGRINLALNEVLKNVSK